MNHLVIAPVLLPLLAGILLLLLPRPDLRLAPRLRAWPPWSPRLGLALALMRGGQRRRHPGLCRSATGRRPSASCWWRTGWRPGCWSSPPCWPCSPCSMPSGATDAAGRHFHVLFQFQLLRAERGLSHRRPVQPVRLLRGPADRLLRPAAARRRARSAPAPGCISWWSTWSGSTLFLFAVGTLYGVLGTLNMADLAVKVAADAAGEPAAWCGRPGCCCSGSSPSRRPCCRFYLWLPAAYAHASAPVAALFAIMTKVGAYSILRV